MSGNNHTCSKLILVVANLGFLTAAVLLLVLGVQIHTSHWSDVFDTSNAISGTVVTGALITAGAFVAVVSVMGLVGAFRTNRCLLYTYSLFALLALVVFVGIMSLGFATGAKAKAWATETFPVQTVENDVAESFNGIYCSAQAGRFCSEGSTQDAAAAFYPTLDTATFLAAVGVDVNAKSGLLGLCSAADAKIAAGGLTTAQLPDGYKAACDACKALGTDYLTYNAIYRWSDDNCRLTPVLAAWCGNSLGTKNPDKRVLTTSPYAQCRPAVLDLWKTWGNRAGVGSAICAAVALLLVIAACRAAKKDKEMGGHASVETPTEAFHKA
ncbi:Aste57867_15124 [Aphanomyces stellatus]|uniref:Aste57867_15124 protein n=1 Tax=Aphanomyces stellatus TaxID=120398 RepID=A0A485L2G5_9STRA|nr:hypothetical protein As57867_015068 [Aphanomyces stellatus]VFT91934.1 Aste57867_15124 [Aphanomyces stellatus]